MTNVLFVTWDGPDTDYVETLFNPIFARLPDHGYKVHTLQFTWADRKRVDRIREASMDNGIPYRAHRILRTPVTMGALGTAIWGRFAVRGEIRRNRIDVIMPRSTLPALSTMLACPRRADAPAFLLDADGLPHDERVEFGGWSSSGLAYRLLRDLEAESVRRADRVLVRSGFAAEVLRARAGPGTAAGKFRTVSNGRDPDRFRIASASERDATRRALGVPADAPLLVYAGTIGDQYYPDKMRSLFEALCEFRDNAHFLIMTGNPQYASEYFGSGLQKAVRERISVLRAPPGQVPAFLGAADLALSFRVPGFSMRAVFPVKLGEYLLSGLPVITNRGIGDLDGVIGSSEAVCILDRVDGEGLKKAARWAAEHALPNIDKVRPVARNLGLEFFSMDRTVESYVASLNEAMACRKGTPSGS